MNRRKLLVPTDFTSISYNALDYSIELAKKINGDIILFHSSIVPDTDPLSPAYATHQGLGQPEIAYQNLVSSNMEELQTKVTEKGLGEINCEYVTEAGNPVGDLKAVAKEHNADFIILGIAGESNQEDQIIISNILRVIDESEHPVLIVPETYRYKNPEKILYATDDIKGNEKYINELGKLVKPLNAEVIILHVQEDEEEDFSARTEELKSGLAYQKTSFITIKNDDVIDGLISYINANNADMVVMHKHKQNFIERIFKDSLTEKMASKTKVPLLIYHD